MSGFHGIASLEETADKTMVLNMGPQHPSTHGVLRLLLEIDGETVVRMMPEIGYLHTGIEKTCEAKFYQQVVPLTDRFDYLCPMTNNLCYFRVGGLALDAPIGFFDKVKKFVPSSTTGWTNMKDCSPAIASGSDG